MEPCRAFADDVEGPPDELLQQFDDVSDAESSFQNDVIDYDSVWAAESSSPAKSRRSSLGDATPAEWGTQGITIADVFRDETVQPTLPEEQNTSKRPLLGYVSFDEIAQMHPGKLFRCVIDYISPEVQSLLVGRKRLMDKKDPGWQYILSSVVRNPMSTGLFPRLNRARRWTAQRTMVKWACAFTGLSHRDIMKSKTTEFRFIIDWGDCSDELKSKFYFLHQLERHAEFTSLMPDMFPPDREKPTGRKVGRGGRAHSEGQFALCFGFSATYNTKIGLYDKEVTNWVQEGLRGDALRDKLRSSVLLKDCFQRFSDHIQRVADSLKFPSWAVAMEHGGCSKHPARIHFHAFAGVDISRGFGIMTPPKAATVDKESLTWEGCSPPFVRFSQFKKISPSVVVNSISTALYYVAGAKASCIFSDASVWPFKDGR